MRKLLTARQARDAFIVAGQDVSRLYKCVDAGQIERILPEGKQRDAMYPEDQVIAAINNRRRNYVTGFSFHPFTPVKAYVLGFAWADGAIDAPLNVLAFVSKDDLSSLRDVFYPEGDRPVYQRKDGAYQLNVGSQRIVQELVEMGFTPQKSKAGVPAIPQGFEQYFLLGLLDGDGTVYTSTDKVLRVFYCGNRETMELVQATVETLVEVRFSMRKAQGSDNQTVMGRTVTNNHVCHVLQLPTIRDSQTYLTWLYSNIDGIPVLQRKYQKFLDFQQVYKTVIGCFLCDALVARPGTTRRYCDGCNLLLRRLSNRRSDHENRKGVRPRFIDLLTDAEKARIDLDALATLG
ncbi:hypothetical protein KDH_11630 [Dictyobacter sp. S3.2.2.5]|uniref:DOD-type homing endonuclease domain-containing protein n=1 Tax=Dictyobacter halimunensis TaxID=3026934 RepID=A0ABQ6FJE2_9CHLR|nr:hypothetical protein KDH_11630 [Dictyobacter sp. S3.2.2.5]